jgi:phosphatidate phosphatase APP1
MARKWQVDHFNRIQYRIIPDTTRAEKMQGYVSLIEPNGINIISDINNKSGIGITRSFQKWSKHYNVTIHYVSPEPWSSYQSYSRFLKNNDFPFGVVHMRPLPKKRDRNKESTGDTTGVRQGIIRNIMRRYSKRKTIVVVDNAQRLAIYEAFARKYPNQIRTIYILNDTKKSVMPEKRLQQLTQTFNCKVIPVDPSRTTSPIKLIW